MWAHNRRGALHKRLTSRIGARIHPRTRRTPAGPRREEKTRGELRSASEACSKAERDGRRKGTARAKREAPKGEARREGAVCRRALAVSDSPLERVSRWLGVGNGFVSGSGEINDSGKGVSIVWTRDACFGMRRRIADAMLGDSYR